MQRKEIKFWIGSIAEKMILVAMISLAYLGIFTVVIWDLAPQVVTEMTFTTFRFFYDCCLFLGMMTHMFCNCITGNIDITDFIIVIITILMILFLPYNRISISYGVISWVYLIWKIYKKKRIESRCL